ncbi:MAG: ribose 5-phosphate isomerase B [Salibacteraceae bacterium]
MKIAIASDHAGFELKEHLKNLLKSQGHDLTDHGTFSADSVDYPDYAHLVSRDVLSGKVGTGILICGSANGMAMAANKHRGIRCAICWQPVIAELARQHNDANILALPARFLTHREAEEICIAFLQAKFEGGRHARRVAKIDC